MEKILILGNGGHAKSVIDVLEKEDKYEIAGIVVNTRQENKFESRYPVIGCDDELAALYESGIKKAAMGIGFLGKGNLRKSLWMKLKKIGFSFPIICDPSAILANDISIGEGCFIGKRAVINTGAVIEKMGIINTGAIIEHECHVGEFSHISVGSILCGNVQVDEAVFVGANATVIQGISIGKQSIVGAGVTVKKDIGENGMIKSENLKRKNNIGGGYKLIPAGGAAA